MNVKPSLRYTSSWDEYLQRIPVGRRDVYFSELIHRCHAEMTDQAECFVYEEGESLFLLPYLKRKIETLPDRECYDFETVYGYSGPLSNTAERSFAERACLSFAVSAKDRGIVAGFVRCHPFIANHDLLHSPFVRKFDRQVVVMDLTQSKEVILGEQIHQKHRNAIHQAERSGLTFELDPGFEHIEEFIGLYNQTMAQLMADSIYFFSRSYYEQLMNLDDNLLLTLVRSNGKAIAAALFYCHGAYAHYHLAGSDSDGLPLRPNNLLLYRSALALKEKGARLFNLGGGTSPEEENSLFRFKARFSALRYPFYTATIVTDRECYELACANWLKNHPNLGNAGYFLSYRLDLPNGPTR